MLDFILAILHHFFAFGLFAVLFAELVTVRSDMNNASVRRVAAIDAWYGALAALVLIMGFVRAIIAAKGWDYYMHNMFFWAKIGTFIMIGLLSIPPTLAFLRWRRLGNLPTNNAIAKVRRFLWIEMALFPLLPVFAAAMARGFGRY